MVRSMFALAGVVVSLNMAIGAEPPSIETFRVDPTRAAMFHVRFRAPDNLILPPAGNNPANPARLPRLVGPGANAAHVSYIANTAFKQGGLEFVGWWPFNGNQAVEEIEFRLIYPVATKESANRSKDPFERASWIDAPIALKYKDARNVNSFFQGKRSPVQYDDFQGMYASAMEGYFAALQRQSPDFGFYPFARAAIARKFDVPTSSELADPSTVSPEYRHIYEIFTGGSALTDSLQTNRILKSRKNNDRFVTQVGAIRGIDVPEHPWEKMIGDKKPRPEPLAQWIPADNYYVRFRNLDKLIDFGELLDQWGNNLMHAFNYRTRDYGLRERYERQLGIPSRQFAKDYPAKLIKGIAITGSDPYLRDGSDVAVIFHVTDADRFVKLHERYVEVQANELRIVPRWTKSEHGGIRIESSVNPDRTLSIHRAVIGDHIIVANSPVGIRRILDVRAALSKSLADSLDFKYMRVCFKADDAEEDGFAFLSDAFIRRLMGPAERIKQMRRAEALASLQLATNGALLESWYQRKLPENTDQLFQTGWVTPQDLQIADSGRVEWNGKRATSERYGSIHFATPLIELPIDWITADEKAEYEQFRGDYLRLWRRFFDPVGMRFHQDNKKVVMEAFILPLVFSQDYEILRALSQGSPAKFDLSKVNSKTMLHFMTSLSLPPGLFGGGEAKSGSLFLRVDDDKLIPELVELLIDAERNGWTSDLLSPVFLQKVTRMPIVLGIEGDVVKPAKELLKFAKAYLRYEEFQDLYRGITIEGRRIPKDHRDISAFNLPDAKEIYQPTFYYAEMGEGIYFSFRKELVKDLIDQHLDKKKSNSKAPEVNAAVRLIPKAAPDTREALNRYFEWQSHRQALHGNQAWFALHHAGVIPKGSTEADERAAAKQFLGYVPISPDKSSYLYDSRLEEVVNRRHGSWRQPKLHKTLSANAPLREILDQSRAIQLELRFREDGVHTTVTIEKNK